MCGEYKQGKERAQSHFPVCAWSQTPILGLVSHLISRKNCMRRALDRTGATIRLWYLALVSCQIGKFWSCCAARRATLTFSMQQRVGRNEQKRPTVATENGAPGRKTTMLSKMKRSTVHASHIHTKKEIAKAVILQRLSRQRNLRIYLTPLFSCYTARDCCSSAKGVWAGKRDLALCVNKIMPLTTRTTLLRDLPAV